MASTKYCRRQKIGVDKIMASTNDWHQQKLAGDKTLASTKYMHKQNVGACADYVQTRRSISLLLNAWNKNLYKNQRTILHGEAGGHVLRMAGSWSLQHFTLPQHQPSSSKQPAIASRSQTNRALTSASGLRKVSYCSVFYAYVRLAKKMYGCTFETTAQCAYTV